jgi:polar amino acid transport system substrate-binding protein
MSRSKPSSPTFAACRTNSNILATAFIASRPSFVASLMLLVATAVLQHIPATARTLEAVQTRGAITICAHANALPFSSRMDKPPGFQIELARALAQQLNLSLAVAWVVTPNQYRAADCDMVLDTIVDSEVQAQTQLRVSKPYHHSGVALALPAGAMNISSFRDFKNGERVGVQVGSIAQIILGQRGVQPIPFAFEDEILEALASGSLDGAAVSPAAIGYFNLTHPNQNVRLVHAYEQETGLSWDVAVGMRGSDNPLRESVDAALDRLLADGTIQDIYAHYGIEHRPPTASR